MVLFGYGGGRERGLAAGFGGGEGGKLGGEFIGFVGVEAELEDGDGGDVEAGLASAAIDEHGDGDGSAAGLADEVEALDHAAAAGDDVFDDEHFLAGREGEAAAEGERVVDLLGEDVAGGGLAGDFLADDEAAHGRGEHGGKGEAGEPGGQECGEAADGSHVLADFSALKKVAAVQARAEHEMALQEGSRAGEYIEHFGLGGVHRHESGRVREKPKTILRRASGGGSLMAWSSNAHRWRTSWGTSWKRRHGCVD